MNFSVNFQSRDFSAPIMVGLKVSPLQLSWSAFGGPDRSLLRLDGDPERILGITKLLRCPVQISDSLGVPAWWGFVDEITIYFEGIKISVALAELFNKVKVAYSFISPDNKLADQLETTYAEDLASQLDYGLREIILQRNNLDETFAENLRDTFLSLHAWPKSVLSKLSNSAQPYVILSCSGWFATLGWQAYENAEGFYANYGPGPGAINFGRPNWRMPAQRFTPGVNCEAKYLYFLMRKNQSPTGNLVGRLYDENSAAVEPNNLLASSISVLGSTLPASGYRWMRFTFDPPYSLTAFTPYWLTCFSIISDATHNFLMRVDENNCYSQEGHYAKYFDAGIWKDIPNVTAPLTHPSLYFRLVCTVDSGAQLLTISTAGNQYFNQIMTLATNVDISPYQMGQRTCLEEIVDLMKLGTSNQRMILAKVSPERRLNFYEQPEPTPTAFLDRKGRFFSLEGKPLAPYFPPVGQHVYFSGSNNLSLPFDKNRVPTCFIQHVEVDCLTGQVRINTHE